MMNEQTENAGISPVERRVRPVPDPVARLLRYAGQTMRTARSPNMTARESIVVGEWMAAMNEEFVGLCANLAEARQDWRKLMDRHNALHINARASRDRVARLEAEVADLRQQLEDEKRQHEITRGDLARTRLACDELLAADDGRNVAIGGRPAPVAICTRMDLTNAQREQLRTTMMVAKGAK